jgi:hypothetical protein
MSNVRPSVAMFLPLQRVLAFAPGGLLARLSKLEVEREDSRSLVLDADGRLVVFDKLLQSVCRSGRAVASFPSIETIDVEHFTNGKRFEWWTLTLRMKGGKRIRIGRSVDDAAVSIAAARVASVVGKKVSVAERVGL